MVPNLEFNTASEAYAALLKWAKENGTNLFHSTQLANTLEKTGNSVFHSSHGWHALPNIFHGKDSLAWEHSWMFRRPEIYPKELEPTTRFVHIFDDAHFGRTDVVPTALWQFTPDERIGLCTHLQDIYAQYSVAKLDVFLMRMGIGAGMTILHPHAHTAMVQPGHRPIFFNGRFAWFAELGVDPASFPNCLSPANHKLTTKKLLGSGITSIRVLHLDGNDNVAEHYVLQAAGHKTGRMNLLHVNTANVLFLEAAELCGNSPDSFIYHEHHQGSLELHVIKVVPGSCVRIVGRTF